MSEDERVTRGMKSQLAERRRRLARDDRGLGWKLGFGTPAAMEKLGIDAPLVGYLLESGRLESGAVVDISNWGNPRLEPEIVARVGEDGGIAAIGAAIELIDLDPASGDPEAILAADIFQRHVLLGPVTEGASVADVSLRLSVNGEQVAAADDVTEATGDLDGLVRPRRQDARGGRRVARAGRHGDLRLDRHRARDRARRRGRRRPRAARQPGPELLSRRPSPPAPLA